jgi:hypothetical protein
VRWFNLAQVVVRVLMLVVLVASGVYLLVYLNRWEWNRALVAGIFFVASEVALLGASLTTRMRQLERRVDTIAQQEGETPSGRRPFRWLEDTTGGLGVFVPVLLGAGVLLSLLAWVVERLARFAAAPLTGDDAVGHFRDLQGPPGGLVPPAGGPATALVTPVAVARRPAAWRGRLAVSVVIVVGVLAVGLGVQFLQRTTTGRFDSPDTGVTTMDLRIVERESLESTEEVGEALWVACRVRVPGYAQLIDYELLSEDAVRLRFTPALSASDQKRLTGCMEDALIDRVSAEVTSFTADPAAPVP